MKNKENKKNTENMFGSQFSFVLKNMKTKKKKKKKLNSDNKNSF